MSKYGFLQNAAGHNSHFQFRFPTVCIELCKFVFKWLWMGYINHVCLCCFFPIRYKANDLNYFKGVSWRRWSGDIVVFVEIQLEYLWSIMKVNGMHVILYINWSLNWLMIIKWSAQVEWSDALFTKKRAFDGQQ